MTLFIVEDDKLQSLILEMMTSKLGLKLTGIEAYGKNAVKRILDIKPDIVLMDIMLKDSFDGINVVKEIKKIYQPIVIYVTGNSDNFNIKRAKQYGFHDYMTKPISYAELKYSIQTIESFY